jgi:Kdo2-lipid IVA lauroyltransferase/acyltransferase
MLDSANAKTIEKEFYKNLSDYGVETLKLISISKEELGRRMKFTNLNVIEDYKKQNRSVIILASHNFNWEWLLAAGNFSLPLPVDFVYQPVNNDFFDNYSLLCRTRFGAHAIKRDQVARELIKRKNTQRCIAIIADQYPGLKTDKRYPAHFLNQETVFFMGANQIASLTQYPVVFAEVKKIGRGFYEATFKKIAEPPYEKDDTTVIDMYIKILEENIVSDPSGWLWSHNRWKKRHLKKTSRNKTG